MKQQRAAAKAKPVDPDAKLVIASNRAARRNFDLFDTVEAGMVLQGSEVKSLRDAQVQMGDGFVRIANGEAWLHGIHIAPYGGAGLEVYGHDPDRIRKLLLHKNEIVRLGARMDREGLTMVPLQLYFRRGRAKVELALARGRKVHDKRQDIAKRDADREAARAMSAVRRD